MLDGALFTEKRGAQPRHGLGMQLADTRLGHTHHHTDLALVQILFVVEGHHQLFTFGQMGDRGDECAAGFTLLEDSKRIGRGTGGVMFEIVLVFAGEILDLDKLVAARFL